MTHNDELDAATRLCRSRKREGKPVIPAGRQDFVAAAMRLAQVIVWTADEGHYSTEDEVGADALRLMQAGDEAAEIKRVRLKDAIERGDEDVAAGKVIRLESDDQVDAFFADL